MTEALVRAPRHSDQAAWAALWADYNASNHRRLPPNVTATTWARLLDPAEPMHALLAERDGALAGFAHLVLHRHTGMVEPACTLQDLFVAAPARRQGTGRALVRAACEMAARSGCTRLDWQTHETNEAAMALYDRLALRVPHLQYRLPL